MICSILPSWINRSSLGRKDVMVALFFSSPASPRSSELVLIMRLRRETVLWDRRRS